MFPLLGAAPRCSGCCPQEIFSTPGCHPGSWGDLLGKNALCAFSAALFRQLRVTLLTQSWSFSLHSFQMQERCSADPPWPSHLQAKEQNQLKMSLEAPKSSVHGLQAMPALHRAGMVCPVWPCPLAQKTFPCWIKAGSDSENPLPFASTLRRFCIIPLLVCVFGLLF